MELTYKKKKVMKKILAFIILSIALVSCYENYILDYTHTGVYFPYQQDVRSFIVGEGMKIEVGPAFGGVRKNTIDRTVNYVFDNTLITPARLNLLKIASQPYIKNAALPVVTLKRLSGTYYTITDSTKFIIKSGWPNGTVVIKADSTKFLNDSVNTLISTYVLPFKLTSAPEIDTILASMSTNIVGVKFENKLFGYYWHGGAAVVNRPTLADTTIVYKTTIPTASENPTWTLTTAGPSTLKANAYYNVNNTGVTQQLLLVLKGTKVYVSAAAGSAFAFTPDGESSFNNPKLLQDRRIYIKYKYTNAVSGYTYHCTDTLRFRNRLHDGTNEWFDTDASHYTK